ncbi:MAG: replication-relaxation family protein [Chloroflexota bacterium]|nr:replication-relaxation family protein [Chloroflexota bacterium]
MKPVEADALRLLSHMPLLDRLEAVAVSGWSRGGVYNAVESLEREGLAIPVSHASELTPATRRYLLTEAGLRRLAGIEGASVDGLLRSRPVSDQWRRVLMERLDALGVVYRLASAISTLAHPVRFRWYRAMPMDAAIALPDGRVIAVVRQGAATDRTGFSKRLWRLREGTQPAAALLLMPDETRLRHARRLLAGAPFIAYLALERDAASAGAGAAVWRTPSGAALLDLRTVLDHMGPRGPWPEEEPPARASLPTDLDIEGGQDWMLPAMLTPVEKRALDLLADWPWLTPAHLGALMGLKRSRLSEVVGRLTALDLALNAAAGGRRRLAVSDRGLAMLARRDRASVGGARKRWSAAPTKAGTLLSWRSVSGRRAGQLLRNVQHTAAVHGFIAALSRQARSRSREIVQLDPPRRASRYFRHADRLRSIHPDAFCALRRGDATWAFFLEWERRAVRPVTMAARLAPYLRYYSSQRPTDDHGARPDVLVVFDDDIAQTHFLRIAREEMARAGVEVPLLVSHRELVEREGPLGRAWRRPGVPEPVHAFTGR